MNNLVRCLVVLKYSRSFPCTHSRKLPALVTFRNVKTVWTFKLCNAIRSFRPIAVRQDQVDSPEAYLSFFKPE